MNLIGDIFTRVLTEIDTDVVSISVNSEGTLFDLHTNGQVSERDIFTGVFSAQTLTPNPNALPSNNWSGYVAETSFSQPQAISVTAVYGSWNVPTVTGPSSGATYSSVWVGIDGYGGNSVGQVGTEEDVVNGSPVYRAWWEMYSKVVGQPEQVISSMTVLPGDSITASVQYITTGAHAGQFYLSIVDNSRANDSFNTYESSAQTQNPQAQRNCAEWIVEAPTVNGSIAQVANFSPVTFTNASAVINGVSGAIDAPSWQSRALNLVSNSVTEDTTSVLSDSWGGFTVTFNSALGAVQQTGAAVGAAHQGAGSSQQGAVVGVQLVTASEANVQTAIDRRQSAPARFAVAGASDPSALPTFVRQLGWFSQRFLIDHPID